MSESAHLKTPSMETLPHSVSRRWRDYYELTKPRVVMLMIVTVWVGMLLATPHGALPAWQTVFYGTIGIAMCAGSGAVMNHLVEKQIDVHMTRTQGRPVASGRVKPLAALLFALGLCLIGLFLLSVKVNILTAWLTFLSLVGYALIYTLFLKRTTPQNIVIGGAAGAAPPLLGWTAVTGQLDPNAWLLVLIIFAWTPPHFWALAIYRRKEYARTQLPMLPVTHGVPFTKLCIVLYTLLLIACSVLPYLTHLSGVIYLISALGLGAGFLFHAIRLYRRDEDKDALKAFGYSILYLFGLFIALLLDHTFR